MNSSDDWKRILERATLEVQKAVADVASKGERTNSVGTGASGDKTLVADKQAEDLLLGHLSQIPRLRVISEEAGEMGPADAGFVAVIDPLDGSSNFERGVPFYCSSVGVADGPTLGSMKHALVRNLITGDVYWAERGKGATKNGQLITTNAGKELRSAVAAIDVSRASVSTVNALAPLISEVGRQVHLGANALELCLLAEGAVDIVTDVRGRARFVDLAGAYLVAKEAGAMITDPSGRPIERPMTLKARFDYVASADAGLHQLVLKRLALPDKA